MTFPPGTAVRIAPSEDPHVAERHRQAGGVLGVHSITSSARARSDGGTSRPSALAVLRLITKSNFVGCSTGMSPGAAPLKTFTIKAAERLLISAIFGP